MAFRMLSILRRRYQEMFNAPLSSLMVILGPIIMMLVAGLALSDNALHNINANIYFDEESDFSNKLVTELNEKTFNIQQSPTLGDCTWPVLEGVSQVCIEVKKRDINSPALEGLPNYGYRVNLHVDFSRQRTVWAVINVVREIISQEEANIKNQILVELKEKLSTTITDIDTALDEITNAKRELRSLQIKIQNDGLPKIRQAQIDVGEAEAIIADIGSTITLLEQNGADNAFPNQMNELRTSHTAADTRIDELQADLTQAENDLEDINNRIGPTLTSLDETEEYLREVQNKLILVRDSDLNEVANPIPLTYTPITGETQGEKVQGTLGFIDYLFPSFLMFFVMFASVILSTSLTIKERSSPAFIRNMLSKTSGVSFVFGNFIATFTTVLLQAIIIMFVGSRFLGLSLLANIWPIIGILTIAITWFILIGLVIGHTVKSNEGSTVAAVSLALILLIFMPAITPTESLPSPAAEIVGNLPSNTFETQLRAIALFNVPFGLRSSETTSIITSSIILLLLLFFLYQRAKSKEI